MLITNEADERAGYPEKFSDFLSSKNLCKWSFPVEWDFLTILWCTNGLLDVPIRTLFSLGTSRCFKAFNKLIPGCFLGFSGSGMDTSFISVQICVKWNLDILRLNRIILIDKFIKTRIVTRMCAERPWERGVKVLTNALPRTTPTKEYFCILTSNFTAL